jgi:hypothetical protein
MRSARATQSRRENAEASGKARTGDARPGDARTGDARTAGGVLTN